MFPHTFQAGEEEEGYREKASRIQSPSMGQSLEPRSQSLSLQCPELGKPEEPGAGSSAYLEQHFSSGCAAALPWPIYVSSRGRAGRLISPAPALLLLTGPSSDVELKSSRISSAPGARQIEWANRKLWGLQHQGSRVQNGVGAGGCRPAGPQGWGLAEPIPFSMEGSEFPPLFIVPHSWGEEREGRKIHKLAWRAGTPQEMLPSHSR